MTHPPETMAYFAGRRLAACLHGITTAEQLEERARRYTDDPKLMAAFIRGFEGGKI